MAAPETVSASEPARCPEQLAGVRVNGGDRLRDLQHRWPPLLADDHQRPPEQISRSGLVDEQPAIREDLAGAQRGSGRGPGHELDGTAGLGLLAHHVVAAVEADPVQVLSIYRHALDPLLSDQALR